MPSVGTGRHAAPRRRRALVTVAVIAAVAVGASVVGARGTFALWNASASVGGGTVRSGTATIDVGILPPLYSTALAPGDSTFGAFSVANTGSVALDVRVVTTSTRVAYAGSTPDSTVLSALTLHLSSVASPADCAAGRSGASGALATFDTGSGYYRLPAKAKAFACVEVSLAADAPQSVSGAVADFTITVSGVQVTS